LKSQDKEFATCVLLNAKSAATIRLQDAWSAKPDTFWKVGLVDPVAWIQEAT